MSDETKNQKVEEEDVSVHKGMPDRKGKRRSPWSWVGTLYFAEGIPYILAMTVSIIMYKKLGISNTDIVLYTSLLYLPWTVKPLWSPIVDILKTKRWWVILMQFFLGITMVAVAMTIPMPNFFRITLLFFWLMAFSSATHDIACDGFYMLALTKHQQAWFVGVRSTFYRFAMITGQGLLVVLAGSIESRTGLEPISIKVNAVQEAKAPIEFVKRIELSDEDKAFLENKTPLEKIRFYVTKAEASKTLDEVTTYASLANEVVSQIKKENPNSPDLPSATKMTQSASEPLNMFLTELIAEKQKTITPLDGKLRLIVSAEELNIPIGQIPKADSDLTLLTVKKWNELQGQREIVIGKAQEKKPKQPGPIKKSWKNYVVLPLETFLKSNFGEKKKEFSKVSGNIAYLYFHLSKAPPQGKNIVVTFGRKSGDKTIELKEGMRFVFNSENWNKPAKAALQIDHRLKEPTKALYLTSAGNILLSWTVTFVAMAALFFFFCIYHFIILPHPSSDTSRYEEAHRSGIPFKMFDFVREFGTTFVSFFRKKGIVRMILYLCLYRYAESQLTGLNTPFYLDPREAGGLALTTGQVGIAYGTVGLIGLIVGGLLGGFVAARDGLKKWVLWMVLAINIPDIVYVILSYTQPENFAYICALVGFETLGYGFGFAAYALYMIYIAEGEHKTAHYAIATGFMALGMMIPRMPCGWLQSIIGYKHFFVWVMLATIPSFIIAFIIPLDPEFGKKKKKEQAG